MRLRIKELIAREDLQIGYVASLLKVNRATMRNWIKGRTPIPFWAAIELSKILKCSLYDLFEE